MFCLNERAFYIVLVKVDILITYYNSIYKLNDWLTILVLVPCKAV